MDDDREPLEAQEPPATSQDEPASPENLAHFEDLFRRHYKATVAFLIRQGFDREDARDHVQEAFIRVYRNMDRFRGETPEVERAYIFTTARNVGWNAIRDALAKKRRANLVSLSDLPSPENIPSTGGQGFLLTETAEWLAVAMRALPEILRTPLMLRIKEASYNEIADALGLKVGTVKSYLTRARHRLRELLAEEPTGIEWPEEPPEDAP